MKVSLFFHFRNHWTNTSYMRAIDFWVIFCYIGMFFALMEYIVILHLCEFFTPNGQTVDGYGNQIHNQRKMIADTIERITRCLLPLYNIVFPIVYFIICTSQGSN